MPGAQFYFMNLVAPSGVVELRGRETVHAVIAFINNRVFGTERFSPYQKHGWRAQRAGVAKTCADENPSARIVDCARMKSAIRAQSTILDETPAL